MEEQLILNLTKEAINFRRTDSERKELVYQISKLIGEWDFSSRYYVFDKYSTNSLYSIRSPSRRWGQSHFIHIHSTKYLKQLAEKLEQQ